MPDITIGGQTEARYIKETSEGGGVPGSGTLKIPGNGIMRVGLTFNGNRQQVYDVGEVTKITDTTDGVKEFELVTEFKWTDDTDLWTMLQDTITRGSNGRLPTYAWEIAKAVDATTKSYYTFKGCRASSVELSVDVHGIPKWIITWKAIDVATAAAAPAVAPVTRATGPLAGAFFAYPTMVLEDGGAAALAVATGKFGFRIEHNLTEVPNVGSTTYKTWSEGRRTFVWTGTISVDDGGKALWDAAVARTEIAVVIKASSTAGKPKITLNTTSYPELTVESDDSGDYLTADVTKPAESITLGTV